jgi:hypothetical protein
VILVIVNLVIIAFAVVGPPLFAVVPWAWFRPASPWPLAAAAAVFAALFAWGGLSAAAAVSAVWVLVAAAWWWLSRPAGPRRPVPRLHQRRILREAAERLADDGEIASTVQRWEATTR